MANLKSFDESGLRDKIADCTEFVREVAAKGGFETDAELEGFLDGMDTSVSAMQELQSRGYTTPEQDAALSAYLDKYGQ